MNSYPVVTEHQSLQEQKLNMRSWGRRREGGCGAPAGRRGVRPLGKLVAAAVQLLLTRNLSRPLLSGHSRSSLLWGGNIKILTTLFWPTWAIWDTDNTLNHLLAPSINRKEQGKPQKHHSASLLLSDRRRFHLWSSRHKSSSHLATIGIPDTFQKATLSCPGYHIKMAIYCQQGSGTLHQ